MHNFLKLNFFSNLKLIESSNSSHSNQKTEDLKANPKKPRKIWVWKISELKLLLYFNMNTAHSAFP